MKITMNYIFAHAIAKDEADRNMRKQGRTKWNEKDWNIAAKRFNEIMDKQGFAKAT